MAYGEDTYGEPEDTYVEPVEQHPVGQPKSEGEVWLRIFCASVQGLSATDSSEGYTLQRSTNAANDGLKEYKKHFTTVYPQ